MLKYLLLNNINRQMETHLRKPLNKWTLNWWNQWSVLVSTKNSILRHHFGATVDETGYPI